jgi:hypothetical protein
MSLEKLALQAIERALVRKSPADFTTGAIQIVSEVIRAWKGAEDGLVTPEVAEERIRRLKESFADLDAEKDAKAEEKFKGKR